MWRHPTEQLHNPGSNRALCSVPLPPAALDDDNNADWVARGLSSSGNGSLVASTLRWSSALLSSWGGEGRGGGKEACWIPSMG
jgi:hypothetical protein